ncbi:hypothetical protein ASD45_09520 [Pseudolabrys sp. Root1462]|uniref:hypothetical protein n=1 Tax=Pseudolabrys sp. Root1462 TaxID=1736466 RepID=UPI0007038A45|nr:hypothetical protein [Pseudolabrys sp. Root1462]KQZ01071.1 hypothetical protein ASD45_09520 [Pseudolabrys sp. Root1462]
MSLRHNLILLLTGACCALALIGPRLAPRHALSLGSVVSAAPPLVIEDNGAAADDPALSPIRREATGALKRLRDSSQP